MNSRTARNSRVFSLLLAAVMAAPAFLHAEVALPELTIKEDGQTKRLELRELSIDVQLEGVLAETVLELEFFNHTSRRQEGEFVLTLPEGATVSTYALDINGNMRPGVSVEKEKARHAYETIKRKMVDPGLVEREAGNVYRTRIFPIEPNQPKRVRIGYIRNLAASLEKPLPKDAEWIPFELPLKHGKKLKHFSCRITGVAEAPDLEVTDLPKGKDEGNAIWKWEAKDIILDGKLEARSRIPEPGKPLVRTDRTPDHNAYFVVQGRLPAGDGPEGIEKPKKIRLIWDTSFSGRLRDHKKELAALARYWKWLGSVDVSLQFLGEKLTKPRLFQVRNGTSAGLDAALKEVIYSGIADYSQIERSTEPTLLVSDGEATSPIWSLGEHAEPLAVTLISSNAFLVDPSLTGAVRAIVDLRREDWWDKLTSSSSPVSFGGVGQPRADFSQVGEFFLVTGKLAADRAQLAKIKIGNEDEITISKPRQTTERENWIFARRVWAQQHLVALERAGLPEKITKFAKAERLVSDHTSLIVLERFADHITYRIPPPEPELLVKYQEAIQQKKENSRLIAGNAWKQKLKWHKTDFPWLDSQLENQASSVGIWIKATRTVFEENDKDGGLIDDFEEWLSRAQATIDRKEAIKSTKEFVVWKADVGKRIQKLNEIQSQRKPPEPQDPIRVSVRGFVKHRGNYSGKAPFTLRKAITEAGGPFQVPLSRVYVYRDAKRTGYNMESEAFGDIPLYAGDMIVVEADLSRPNHFLGDAFGASPDPFAAPPAGGGGGTSASRTAAPVFEESGVLQNAPPTGAPAPGGAPRSAYENTNDRNLKIQLVSLNPEQTKTDVDRAILKTLGEQPKPFSYHDQLFGKTFREETPSAATLIEIARFYFEAGEPEMGGRVLSNLIEIQANKFEATRALAYWLAEFGASDKAIEILRQLDRKAPDARSSALIKFDLAQLLDDAGDGENEDDAADWYSKAVLAEIESEQATALSTIALTDHFGRIDQPAGTPARGDLRGFLADPLASDVRIVLVSASDKVDLLVTEPGWSEPNLPVGTSAYGGRTDRSERVSEYQMRFGLPGTYRVKCRRAGFPAAPGPDDFFRKQYDKQLAEADLQPITIQITYYTRWGTADQEKHVRTYLMEKVELDLDGLEFGWKD